ncbi:MAG: hypothetical protein R3F01_02615 [Lysobacteraceae bacterium]
MATIENWWKQVDAARSAELQAMWQQAGAGIPPAEAAGRSLEAVCAARDPDGRLIAISTAQPRLIPFLNEYMFYFRVFVVPALRRGRLGPQLAFASRQLLNDEHQRSDDPEYPIGLFLEIESPALSRDGDRAVWSRPAMKDRPEHTAWPHGALVYAGRSPRGLDRRLWYFDEARLRRPGLPRRR